jgi:hypothetical protein
MSYADDRRYSERFIPLVKQYAGPHLLRPSSFEVDTKEAADLVVLRAEPITIGVRIRRPGYEEYINEFTLRAKRDNGVETELSKVIRGWMTWFFYGHGNEELADPHLRTWMLLDMDVFRYALAMRGQPRAFEKGAMRLIPNGDGTHFAACDLRRWPRHMVIASSDQPQPELPL